MSASAGLFLAVGAISGGNEWLHGNIDSALKVGVATLGTTLIFSGIEKIPDIGLPFAVGVGTIALITVIFASVTPGVPSPASQILSYMGYSGKATATIGDEKR